MSIFLPELLCHRLSSPPKLRKWNHADQSPSSESHLLSTHPYSVLSLSFSQQYSDIDTIPLLPVTQWGALHPRLFDISATDGPGWWMNIKEKPEVVIGVDVDV